MDPKQGEGEWGNGSTGEWGNGTSTDLELDNESGDDADY